MRLLDSACLGFANASISSATHLRGWLESEGSVEPAAAEEVSLRLQDFLGLQAPLREVLDGAIGGGSLPAAAVERVNEASARVPRVLQLRPPHRDEAPMAASPTALVLARIAWSAIELLGGDGRERLRRCGACGRYFLATRSDRRWCSNACGNRTRVARHHARRRSRVSP